MTSVVGLELASRALLRGITRRMGALDPSLQEYWLPAEPENLLVTCLRFARDRYPVARNIIEYAAPLLVFFMSNYDRCSAWFWGLYAWGHAFGHASVSVPATDPLHDQILRWLRAHGDNNGVKQLAVETGRGNRASDRMLQYAPDMGTHTIRFEGTKLTLERKLIGYGDDEDRGGGNRDRPSKAIDTICISGFFLWKHIRGERAVVIQGFLSHVQEWAFALLPQALIRIHRPQADIYSRITYCWHAGILRPARSLDSVFLPDGVRDRLVSEVRTYLTDSTKSYYSTIGVPWRRGLLLHGPPGTGKTKFTAMLASELNVDIYTLSLSATTISDVVLDSLFEQLPSKCIVLLEDIDSAGIGRESMKSDKNEMRKATDSVTLSGLLNALDGEWAVEGRIIIMTTNHIDRIDPALKRPGRIDRQQLFGYAAADVAVQIFQHFFSDSARRLLGLLQWPTDQRIADLANTFAAGIPAGEITPAEVQEHLLEYRMDPAAAVLHVPDLVERTRQRKADDAGGPVVPVADPVEVHPGWMNARCTVQ
ncbi:hypothetical protein LTR85_010102 [Meristemomyces frigidus]|nr:hypothetical protein LTR85_010102 [Meristemomyces frigidus]